MSLNHGGRTKAVKPTEESCLVPSRTKKEHGTGGEEKVAVEKACCSAGYILNP